MAKDHIKESKKVADGSSSSGKIKVINIDKKTSLKSDVRKKSKIDSKKKTRDEDSSEESSEEQEEQGEEEETSEEEEEEEEETSEDESSDDDKCSDDSSEVSMSSTDILANDPLYYVLSKILVTKDGTKNIADILEEINQKLAVHAKH